MEKEKTDNKEFEKHFLVTAKNSVVVCISVIFGYLLGFVINFILASYFGAKIVGQFTLVKSSITILIIFSTFGFNGGLLKYISKFRAKSDKQKLRFIIFITLSLSFIFSVGLSVLVYFNRNYFSILFNDQELSRLLVYGAWLIIPMTLIKVYSGLYRGYKKVSFYKISNLIIKKIFFVLLLLFFVLYKFKNINYVINGYLFANLLIFV